MKINGLREFSSKVEIIQGQNAYTFASALTQQNHTARDSLSLSDIGKKLSVNIREPLSLREIQKEQNEITDPTIELMHVSLTEAENILKKMHELAALATQETLTDRDRLEIQIEIENLQENIGPIVDPMEKILKSKGMAVADKDMMKPALDFLQQIHQDRNLGNGTSVLDRMRSRIMNGEEWDVKEAYNPYDFLRVIYDEEDGPRITVENYAAQKWYVDESGREDIPTVSEVLKDQSPVVVMDSKSAAEGVAYLEQELESIREVRDDVMKLNDKLVEKELNGTDTMSSEEDITNMLMKVYNSINKHARTSQFNEPTIAEWAYVVPKHKLEGLYQRFPELRPKPVDLYADMYSISLIEPDANFDQLMTDEELASYSISLEELVARSEERPEEETPSPLDEIEIVYVDVPGL